MSAAAWIAGFLSGMLGAMGLGGGSVLILYLTLWAGVEQLQAQGINLTFFLPCAATAILLHSRKKQIEWRLWRWAAPAGAVGAWVGARLGPMIGGPFLRKGFAVFLLIFGAMELLHRKKTDSAFSESSVHTHNHTVLRKRGDAPLNADQKRDDESRR